MDSTNDSGIKWGAEIAAVDGIKPWWLGDSVSIVGAYNIGEHEWYKGDAWEASAFDWGNLKTFRLPADHPHYQKQAEAPAIDPALVERMKQLVRGMAKFEFLNGHEMWFEARDILKALEPVDEDDVLAARLNDDSPYDLTGLSAEHAERNVRYIQATIREAIRRGRQLERGEK